MTKLFFHFIYGLSSFPLTNSYFSRWLLHHQPVIFCNMWVTGWGAKPLHPPGRLLCARPHGVRPSPCLRSLVQSSMASMGRIHQQFNPKKGCKTWWLHRFHPKKNWEKFRKNGWNNGWTCCIGQAYEWLVYEAFVLESSENSDLCRISKIGRRKKHSCGFKFSCPRWDSLLPTKTVL